MKIHRVLYVVSLFCFAMAARVVIASGGSSAGGASIATIGAGSSAQLAAALSDETGSAGSAVFSTSPTLTTPIIATLNSGVNASSNTTAVTAGAITGGTHVAGGTADQSSTLTISSPDSKGSGESKLIFKVPVPTGSGTGVNAVTEVMNVSYVDALASKGVEITGVLDVSGVTRSNGNLIANNATLYLRGANAGVANIDMDFGNTGDNKILFKDNLAESVWLGQGANKYLTFVTTDGGELITHQKPMKVTAATPVAAAGTDITNCGAILAGTLSVRITGADGTKGACLPTTSSVTTCVVVVNQDAAVLKVYGADADTSPTVNGGAGDAAYSQQAGTTMKFCNSGVNWTAQ